MSSSKARFFNPAVVGLIMLSFFLGTSEYTVIGILPEIADGFGISLTQAGSIVSLFAFAYGLGTPFLAAYVGKILFFSLSTGISHSMAYTILESLRLRLADRFLHAPLGDVEGHTIGEIKNMMVDKIESIEPPLAYMIPDGAGHIVLPIVSIAAEGIYL